MDFKFVSHGLWSEKQNILLQHMHKKEFWILTDECENNLKHENEAKGPWPLSIVFVFNIIFTFINSHSLFKHAHIVLGCIAYMFNRVRGVWYILNRICCFLCWLLTIRL